jgi:hypothetical protein
VFPLFARLSSCYVRRIRRHEQPDHKQETRLAEMILCGLLNLCVSSSQNHAQRKQLLNSHRRRQRPQPTPPCINYNSFLIQAQPSFSCVDLSVFEGKACADARDVPYLSALPPAQDTVALKAADLAIGLMVSLTTFDAFILA